MTEQSKNNNCCTSNTKNGRAATTVAKAIPKFASGSRLLLPTASSKAAARPKGPSVDKPVTLEKCVTSAKQLNSLRNSNTGVNNAVSRPAGTGPKQFPRSPTFKQNTQVLSGVVHQSSKSCSIGNVTISTSLNPALASTSLLKGKHGSKSSVVRRGANPSFHTSSSTTPVCAPKRSFAKAIPKTVVQDQLEQANKLGVYLNSDNNSLNHPVHEPQKSLRLSSPIATSRLRNSGAVPQLIKPCLPMSPAAKRVDSGEIGAPSSQHLSLGSRYRCMSGGSSTTCEAANVSESVSRKCSFPITTPDEVVEDSYILESFRSVGSATAVSPCAAEASPNVTLNGVPTAIVRRDIISSSMEEALLLHSRREDLRNWAHVDCELAGSSSALVIPPLTMTTSTDHHQQQQSSICSYSPMIRLSRPGDGDDHPPVPSSSCSLRRRIRRHSVESPENQMKLQQFIQSLESTTTPPTTSYEQQPMMMTIAAFTPQSIHLRTTDTTMKTSSSSSRSRLSHTTPMFIRRHTHTNSNFMSRTPQQHSVTSTVSSQCSSSTNLTFNLRRREGYAPCRPNVKKLICAGIFLENPSMIQIAILNNDEDPNGHIILTDDKLKTLFSYQQTASTENSLYYSPSPVIPYLFLATKLSSSLVVRKLIECGAAPTTVDHAYRTALHHLFLPIPQVNNPTYSYPQEGDSPLTVTPSPCGRDSTCSNATSSVVSVVKPCLRHPLLDHPLQYFPDPTEPDRYRTIVEYLCAAGVQVDAKDALGSSPCDYARDWLSVSPGFTDLPFMQQMRDAALTLIAFEDSLRIDLIGPTLGFRVAQPGAVTEKKILVPASPISAAAFKKRKKNSGDPLFDFIELIAMPSRVCQLCLMGVWEFLGAQVNLVS